MQTLIDRVRSLRVERRGILIESLLFVLIYMLLLVIFPQEAPARVYAENLAIIISSLTAAILIFISLYLA